MTEISRVVGHHEPLRGNLRTRNRSVPSSGLADRAYQQFDEWNDRGLRSSIVLLELHHRTAHQARASMFRSLSAMRGQDEAGALHELLEAERRFCLSNDPVVGYEVGVTAGYIFLDIGATSDALADLETSWAGLALLPTTHLHARCAYLLAEAWSRRGRWSEADRWWAQAREISLQISVPTLMARWEINRFAMSIREALAVRSIGDHEAAMVLAQTACRGLEALADEEESSLPAHTRSLRLLRLGEALRLAGRTEEARGELEWLVSGVSAGQQPEVVAEAHRLLARLAIERNDYPGAYEHCELGLLAARSDHLRHLRSALLGLAAWVGCETGQIASSTAHLREQLELRSSVEKLDALRIRQVHVLYERIRVSAARRRDIVSSGPTPCRRFPDLEQRGRTGPVRRLARAPR